MQRGSFSAQAELDRQTARLPLHAEHRPCTHLAHSVLQSQKLEQLRVTRANLPSNRSWCPREPCRD